MSESVAEHKNQINPGPLDAALVDAVGRTARFGRAAGLRAQEARDLIFELQLGRVAVAELLIEPEERPLVQLLSQRDRCPEPSRLRGGRRNLEQIQIECSSDRFPQRSRDEAGGNAS